LHAGEQVDPCPGVSIDYIPSILGLAGSWKVGPRETAHPGAPPPPADFLLQDPSATFAARWERTRRCRIDTPCFMGRAYSVRDRLMERWTRSQRSFYDTLTKRVHFLPLEFLPGRFLKNDLSGQDRVEEARDALSELGFDSNELEEDKCDAALSIREEMFASTNPTVL